MSNKKSGASNSSNAQKNKNTESFENISKNLKKDLLDAKDLITKKVQSKVKDIPNKIEEIENKLTETINQGKKTIEENINIEKEKVSKSINNIKSSKPKPTISKETKKDAKETKKDAKETDKEKKTDTNSNIVLDYSKKAKGFINNKITKIKNSKHYKLYIGGSIILILLLIYMIFIPKNFKGFKDIETVDKIVNEFKYKVKIDVDFEENIIFSKYDVELISEDNSTTLKHGKKASTTFYLTEGKHTLFFVSKEDESIEYSKEIDVQSNMEYSFKVNTYSDSIKVSQKYLDRDIELLGNKIKMDGTVNSYIKKDYKEVKKELEKLGFTNITEDIKYDVNSKSKYKKGQVSNVQIDGKNSFNKGTIFKSDSKIVITYHLNQVDNPNNIFIPYDTDKAREKRYDKVVEDYKTVGFTNVVTEKYERYSSDMESNKKVFSVKINDEDVSENKSYSKNSKVVITYNVIIYESPFQSKLTRAYAEEAFEKYGKKKFPYGFKCHWIVGLIAEDQSELGDWTIKVKVTIKNPYGQKYEAIAEGNVSGTSEKPTVKKFYVSR